MEDAPSTLRSFKHFEELLIGLELDCDKKLVNFRKIEFSEFDNGI